MSDFAISWNLSRGRFDQNLESLTTAQMNWRLHENALTIGEMSLHVAGVELWFMSQLTGEPYAEWADVMKAATDGVVNDLPFPVSTEKITADFVRAALAAARAAITPNIENPSAALLGKELKSALGPIINGQGALARIAFHSAYHHGQIYQITTAPGFPAG